MAAERHDQRRALMAALADPRVVAARLGLGDGAKRQGGGGLSVRCVAHADRTASLSLFLGRDGTMGARCHGCGFAGTVFDLIAAVYGLRLPAEMGEAMEYAAQLAGGMPTAPTAARPVIEREPPPVEEVRRLLAEGRAPNDDAPARTWLRSRGLDPRSCSPLCRALASTWPTWARAGDPSRPWAALGYGLVLPVWDARGALRSVRARLLRARKGPKDLPPSGCRAAGLVYANRAAVAMLRAPKTVQRPVLLVEGTPDYLTWAGLLGDAWAVIGLPGSGAWTAELGERFLSGAEVVVRTDRDDAGDRYARMVETTIGGRCRVLVTDREGRALRRALCAEAERQGRAPSSGEKNPDDNDLHRAGLLPSDPREGATPA